MQSNVTPPKEAIGKMLEGIKIATDQLRLSYGPKGINATIEHEFYPFHQVTNDAQTIVQAIQVEDKVGKVGLNFLKELCNRADKSAGDGRKATAIIGEEILTEVFNSELSSMSLKKELDDLIPVIEEFIDKYKTSITENDVEIVASIASDSKRIGHLIGEIYKKIGKNGIIHVEGSGTWNDEVNYIEGVRFQDAGYLSPFMAKDDEAIKDNRKEVRAVYENPVVLVTKKKIMSINDIDPLLRSVQAMPEKRALVIFTDDMDSSIASMLVNLHKSGGMNVLIIKAPVLWKNYVFEDFAKITGATIVQDESGINFKTLQLSHLGTCGKIITDREETVVMGIADISDHIADLQKRGDDDSKLRLSWLTTQTAILKLGANSESELSYLRLKTSDAINSSRLALQDGVVSGGGSCLASIASSLPNTEAGNILKKALIGPYNQNNKNMGVVDTEPNLEGVVDAALVVKNAVRNAIGLASIVITAPIVINLPPKSVEQITAETLQQKGLRL